MTANSVEMRKAQKAARGRGGLRDSAVAAEDMGGGLELGAEQRRRRCLTEPPEEERRRRGTGSSSARGRGERRGGVGDVRRGTLPIKRPIWRALEQLSWPGGHLNGM